MNAPPPGNPFLSGLFGKGNNNSPPPSAPENKGNFDNNPSGKTLPNIPFYPGSNRKVGEGNPFFSTFFNRGSDGNSQNRMARNGFSSSEDNKTPNNNFDQQRNEPLNNFPTIATFGPFNIGRPTSPPNFDQLIQGKTIIYNKYFNFDH